MLPDRAGVARDRGDPDRDGKARDRVAPDRDEVVRDRLSVRHATADRMGARAIHAPGRESCTSFYSVKCRRYANKMTNVIQIRTDDHSMMKVCGRC